MGLISLRCGIGDQICVVKIYARAGVIPFVIKQFLLALRRNKKAEIRKEGRASLRTAAKQGMQSATENHLRGFDRLQI